MFFSQEGNRLEDVLHIWQAVMMCVGRGRIVCLHLHSFPAHLKLKFSLHTVVKVVLEVHVVCERALQLEFNTGRSFYMYVPFESSCCLLMWLCEG